ncbi:hypothetical protein [Membranihabitans maritimus]|uniref:hypothetical protein n=1 Tax=Membranihabitans maritimus TaxID=2904244 RepID=UPI001F260B37|nr:hypothetical protein [Membranihabitans maritimus]
MKTITFSKPIKAPVSIVWDTMLGSETYVQWACEFAEGSYFEGSWAEGEKILFLGPDRSGMVSIIAQNLHHQFISIKHIGIVKNGVEDTVSEEASKWAPAYENYTFVEKNGKTIVKIEMDINEEHEEMFSKLWPKALEKLKDLAER